MRGSRRWLVAPATQPKSGLLARLLWFEPFWLLFLAPSILFTEYFWEPAIRPLLILTLFLFWPLRMHLRQPLTPWPALSGLIGFFVVWTWVVIGLSPDAIQASQVGGYILLAVSTFVTMINWPVTKTYPMLPLFLLIALATGLAIIGPESFSINPTKMLDVYQPAPPQPVDRVLLNETINPNVLASALVIVIPLFAALLLRWDWSPYRWLPLLGWIPFGLLLNAVLLSQSRGGFIALFCALSLLFLLRWPKLRWILLVLVLLGSGLLLLGAVNFLKESGLLRGAIESLQRRQEIWLIAFDMLRNSPLTGIGVDSFRHLLSSAYRHTALANSKIDFPPHAHNLFLQLGLDLGLPGFLAWLGICGLMLQQLAKRLVRYSDPRTWSLTAGLLSALSAMLVNGLVDTATWGTRLTFIPWLLFAGTVLITQEAKPSKRSYKSPKKGNHLLSRFGAD